eukprot:12030765-Prorocentrum_lima.AAC.1
MARASLPPLIPAPLHGELVARVQIHRADGEEHGAAHGRPDDHADALRVVQMAAHVGAPQGHG